MHEGVVPTNAHCDNFNVIRDFNNSCHRRQIEKLLENVALLIGRSFDCVYVCLSLIDNVY